MAHDPTQPISDSSTARAAGITIILGSALMLAVVLSHPHIDHGGMRDLVAGLARGALVNGAVHAMAIAAAAVLTLGFFGFIERLGPSAILARAGFTAYALGSIALAGAAATNGLVIPRMALECNPDDSAAVEKLIPLLALCHETNVALDYIGITSWCLAVFLWSVVLVHRPGPSRAIGAFGVIAALGPAVALALGKLPMNIHGLGAFVLLQAIWSIAVAVQLVRARI